MNYGKKTSRTSIKFTFQSFCKIRKIPSPSGAGEELQGAQEASWPRKAPSWVPWTPTLTPPRLETFLLLQKFLLYICLDSPGTVSRDFVCFLFDMVLPGNLSARPRCHGIPKFPQGQVHCQHHQPLPR